MLGFFKMICEDIDAVLERDPAARSQCEVLLCYPGLHALWLYRVSHWLWQKNKHLLARVLSHVRRFATAIEIHPGAQIGRRLFIDHGVGVIIGETAVLGDDVTLYQGVTLGGTGKDKGKRHPTIYSGVVIGAGAKVLGNISIGENSRIGAGSVVLHDVPDNSTVVGVPGHIVYTNGRRVLITNPKDIIDPLSSAIVAVKSRIEQLEQQICDLTVNGARGAVPRNNVQGSLSVPLNSDAGRLPSIPGRERCCHADIADRASSSPVGQAIGIEMR